MTKLMIAVPVLMTISVFAQTSKQSKPKRDNRTSLDETIAFLKENIVRYGGYTIRTSFDSNDVSEVTVKFTAVKFADCNLELDSTRQNITDRRDAGTFVSEVKVQLQDLDPVISIPKNSDHFTVTAVALGEKNVIVSHTRGNLIGDRTEQRSSTEIPFDDQDRAGGVARALSHVIDLCKAKPKHRW